MEKGTLLRENREKKMDNQLTVILLIAGILIGFVVIARFSAGINKLQLAVRIQRAINMDAAGAIEKDKTDLLIGGILGGQVGDRPFRNEAQMNLLIVYALEKWNVFCNDEDGCNGSWSQYSIVFPETITLDGNTIMLKPVKGIHFDKIHVTTKVIRTGSGKLVVDGYRDGAIRLFGYKKGKNVTFLGKRGPDRILNIEYVFGDNCNNYFLYMHNLGIFDMKVSIIFTTITIALGFIISIRI